MSDTERNKKDSCTSNGNGASRVIDLPRSAIGEDAGHEPSNAKNAEVESKVGADWPDPCPLPESLLAVEPFDRWYWKLDRPQGRHPTTTS